VPAKAHPLNKMAATATTPGNAARRAVRIRFNPAQNDAANTLTPYLTLLPQISTQSTHRKYPAVTTDVNVGTTSH
jgi:hypothetical protein